MSRDTGSSYLVHALVERIEDETAFLELPGPTLVQWPADLLPPQVREGDLLAVTLSIAPEEREEAERRVAQRLRHLRDSTRREQY